MPRILAAAHAFPIHLVSQQQARQAVNTIFAGKIPELERLMTIFDNSRIAQRQLVMPLDWYLQPRSLEERNQVFIQQGMSLLRKATEKVFRSSAANVADVAHLIYVNSTGHATPSLDARLINELNFSVQTSRLPIWGLGCAGGAAGLSRARDYCRAHPRAMVLLTALECCSLTLVVEDLSKKNLVGTSLFSDGAAAVLVAGDDAAAHVPEIVASRSQLSAEHQSVENLTAANDPFVQTLPEMREESAEQERLRITRELHDSIGYAMTNITMIMNAAQYLHEKDPDLQPCCRYHP